MTTEQVHTCSYYCDRPECLKDQRDELRDRLEATPPAQAAEAVERVARAIATEDEVPGVSEWNDLRPSTRAEYERMARAAIGAMGGGE